MKISEKLDEFLKLCDDGMNCDNAAKAMRLLGIDGYDAEDLASIDSKGGVEIGDYTMFAENVNIFTW